MFPARAGMNRLIQSPRPFPYTSWLWPVVSNNLLSWCAFVVAGDSSTTAQALNAERELVAAKDSRATPTGGARHGTAEANNTDLH